MKRIYLVKKDPSAPSSDDNWIYMNKQEYLQFIATPEGKSRKDYFAQLDAADEDDVMYIVECENKLVAKCIRADKDAHDYLREQEMKSKIFTVSLDEMRANKEGLSILETLSDSDDDLLIGALKKMELETLRIALNSLDTEEKRIIDCLYFKDKVMSARALSTSLNIPQKTLHNRKMRIYEKIKKYF